MYLGEATVYQVKIEEFIKVAKDLEVNYVKSSRIIESDTPNTKDSNNDAETKNKNLEKETETKDKITSGTSDDLEIEIDIEKTKRRRQP